MVKIQAWTFIWAFVCFCTQPIKKLLFLNYDRTTQLIHKDCIAYRYCCVIFSTFTQTYLVTRLWPNEITSLLTITSLFSKSIRMSFSRSWNNFLALHICHMFHGIYRSQSMIELTFEINQVTKYAMVFWHDVLFSFQHSYLYSYQKMDKLEIHILTCIL